MRPLSKTASQFNSRSSNPEGLLRNELGNYCSICERPLHGYAHAWHAEAMKPLAAVGGAPDWSSLLLLCGNCKECAAAKTVNSSGLALPHRDRTFALGGDSPFIYSLETIQVEYLDEGGAPVGPPQTAEKAIVKATTPAAQATIDYFALNTPYYNSQTSYLQIPQSAFLQDEDLRVDQRTDAWITAARFSKDLLDDDPASRRVALAQLTRLIGATGFWSVWATVLWDELHDPETLSAMLLPPRDVSQAAALRVESGGAGGARRFPGTRPDALFTQPESGR